MAYHTRPPFASGKSFLDRQYDKNGEPLAPKRFKQLVLERFYISANTNTSYVDVGQMTPEERKIVISFIKEQKRAESEAINEANSKLKRNK